MNVDHSRHTFFVLGITAALLLGFSAACVADDGKAVKPLALRTIMQDMGKNMQAISDGISRSDWKLVEKAVALVADHPQPPPEEKARIIGFIGAEMGRFKGYDSESHDHALAVGVAAKAGDGQSVIRAVAQLQTICLSCHTAFREPLVTHFHGKNIAP